MKFKEYLKETIITEAKGSYFIHATLTNFGERDSFTKQIEPKIIKAMKNSNFKAPSPSKLKIVNDYTDDSVDNYTLVFKGTGEPPTIWDKVKDITIKISDSKDK